MLREWQCRHCSVVGSRDYISRKGAHHDRECPRCVLDCDGCNASGTLDYLLQKHNHNILQDCCCRNANGACFRCGKHGCPVKLIVMYGNVWAVYPESVLVHAGRGPNHTIRHRPHYHDYWCDQIRDGEISTFRFESDEYLKISAKHSKEIAKEESAVRNFAIGMSRLLILLPPPSSNTMFTVESESIINATTEIHPLRPFHDLASLEKSLKALRSAQTRADSALYSLRNLVSKLQFVRCIRSQLCLQKFANRSGPVSVILHFIGLKEIINASHATQYGFGLAFKMDEVQKEICLADQSTIEELAQGSDEVVIQEIDHDEPAAQRDPEMLAIQARHDYADNVTQLLHGQSASSNPGFEVETEATEPIFLLAYNRYPDSFRAALAQGNALQPCRSALEEAGLNWSHESGAKIFVHPWQFEDSMAALARSEVSLRPYHVIVATSLEYNVDACLTDLPCREGARVKRRRVLEHAAREDPCHDADFGQETQVEDAGFEVHRTFLCEATVLRHANSVTQSTTEVNGGGLNPRRVLPRATSNRSSLVCPPSF